MRLIQSLDVNIRPAGAGVGAGADGALVAGVRRVVSPCTVQLRTHRLGKQCASVMLDTHTPCERVRVRESHHEVQFSLKVDHEGPDEVRRQRSQRGTQRVHDGRGGASELGVVWRKAGDCERKSG